MQKFLVMIYKSVNICPHKAKNKIEMSILVFN